MVSKIQFADFIKDANGLLEKDAHYEGNYKKEHLKMQCSKQLKHCDSIKQHILTMNQGAI